MANNQKRAQHPYQSYGVIKGTEGRGRVLVNYRSQLCIFLVEPLTQ